VEVLRRELGQRLRLKATDLCQYTGGVGDIGGLVALAAERHRRDVNRLLRRLPKELPRIHGRAWRDLRELMERRRAEAEATRPPLHITLRAVPQPLAGAPTPAVPAKEARTHPAAPPGLTALAPPPPRSGQGE